MSKEKTKNKTKGDRSRNQPLTLEALAEYGGLMSFEPPVGPFDANGAWSHSFRLWMVSEKPPGNHKTPHDVNYRGLLQISRKRLPEEKAISLEIRQACLQDAPAINETQVQLVCADNILASPRRWTLRNTILDEKQVVVPQTEIHQSGEIRGTTLHLCYAGQSVQRQVPEQVSCNWSLWDAIQRLWQVPRYNGPSMKFALLEELDLLKLDQCIDYCGPVKKQINGKTISLHCFQHVGRGLLPYHYYLDSQGRLLLAIGGERAYIYDPNVWIAHKTRISQLQLVQRKKPK